eukprot:CAMPEP_0172202170 /NCGR_PEP_ID=MMETSP1050-20130122/30474_1 /TAXON_ID=233186 /ORGANISM="Cryptomonas curvata, Strain CCAP979/52" /LENGTH=156 /DNA_ID=CAMNT_0012880033 /DNA_START=101 /DNA_END=566 /DNA_ORIENTATION=-
METSELAQEKDNTASVGGTNSLQAHMRQIIEKAVAQFLLQSTNPVHEAPASHRRGASFHGGSEGDEYSVEMDHISQELNHQLSSVVDDNTLLSKTTGPPSASSSHFYTKSEQVVDTKAMRDLKALMPSAFSSSTQSRAPPRGELSQEAIASRLLAA